MFAAILYHCAVSLINNGRYFTYIMNPRQSCVYNSSICLRPSPRQCPLLSQTVSDPTHRQCSGFPVWSAAQSVHRRTSYFQCRRGECSIFQLSMQAVQIFNDCSKTVKSLSQARYFSRRGYMSHRHPSQGCRQSVVVVRSKVYPSHYSQMLSLECSSPKAITKSI